MFCQGHVEDLLDAEHGALGVGSVELLLPGTLHSLLAEGQSPVRLAGVRPGKSLKPGRSNRSDRSEI
jgi:hypothetical protein